MTEDYKERIIKYLTNNYSKDTESTTPFFATNLEIKQLSQQSRVTSTIIQGKDGKGNDLNVGFCYGTYYNTKIGFIRIVDSNFNVIQEITQYNTGTNFREWIRLNIDPANGNIYGIDYDENTQVYRFILLNNFLMKTPAQQDYEVKLRNSYVVNFSEHSFQFIDKSPNSSLYVIIGDDQAGRPLVSTYKIEVGTQNELKDYTYEGLPTGSARAYNIEWTGDDYKIVFAVPEIDQNRHYYIHEYYLDNNSEYITDYFSKTLLDTSYEVATTTIGGLVITNDYTYVSYQSKGHALNNAVRILKFDENTEEEIYYETVEYDNTYNAYLFKKNFQIYGLVFMAINMPAQTANTLYKVEVGIIDNNDNFLYTTNNDLEIYDIMHYTPFFDVRINNNLITYSLIAYGQVRYLQAKQIYNINNWNYTDYQDYNSMIPKSSILYDENNNVIFAKNLYNKTINGNTTVSTLEISNIELNDEIIFQQDLLGETNGTLISNEDSIQKNIYEDVFINFINTITMQDRNSPDYRYNLNGATRVNASISNTADYEETALSKIRINYLDGTSFVKTISPASRISQFVYRYIFNIYVTKPAISLDLISGDENTVYVTILGGLQLNKAYQISQDVEIQ